MPRRGTAKKKVYELMSSKRIGDRFKSRDLCKEVSRHCGYEVSPHVIGAILGDLRDDKILEKEEIPMESNDWVVVRLPV